MTASQILCDTRRIVLSERRDPPALRQPEGAKGDAECILPGKRSAPKPQCTKMHENARFPRNPHPHLPIFTKTRTQNPTPKSSPFPPPLAASRVPPRAPPSLPTNPHTPNPAKAPHPRAGAKRTQPRPQSATPTPQSPPKLPLTHLQPIHKIFPFSLCLESDATR
jgi:hypothetical protein